MTAILQTYDQNNALSKLGLPLFCWHCGAPHPPSQGTGTKGQEVRGPDPGTVAHRDRGPGTGRPGTDISIYRINFNLSKNVQFIK